MKILQNLSTAGMMTASCLASVLYTPENAKTPSQAKLEHKSSSRAELSQAGQRNTVSQYFEGIFWRVEK